MTLADARVHSRHANAFDINGLAPAAQEPPKHWRANTVLIHALAERHPSAGRVRNVPAISRAHPPALVIRPGRFEDLAILAVVGRACGRVWPADKPNNGHVRGHARSDHQKSWAIHGGRDNLPPAVTLKEDDSKWGWTDGHQTRARPARVLAVANHHASFTKGRLRWVARACSSIFFWKPLIFFSSGAG